MFVFRNSFNLVVRQKLIELQQWENEQKSIFYEQVIFCTINHIL